MTEKLQKFAQYFSAGAEVIIFTDKADIDSFISKESDLKLLIAQRSDLISTKIGTTAVEVLGRTIFFAEKSKFVDLITPDQEPDITQL
ncbi:MAG: hypothetical protein KBC56_04800 [Flavobacterium sp.]|nr:hypothetical protein [Flavobacterium sp.]